MTNRKPRFYLLAVACAFGLVEACMLAAFSWNAPPEDDSAALSALFSSVDQDEPTPALRGAPYGVLLQNLQRRPAVAALESEPPRASDHSREPDSVLIEAASGSDGTETGLAAIVERIPAAPVGAPLPPTRPSELAYAEIAAPEPPLRPREFFPREFMAPRDIVEPPPAAAASAPEETAPAISLASLMPATDSPGPLQRHEDGNFRLGAAAYVRIFKKEGELELWLRRNGRYALYKTYPVCKWSGRLGPKLRSGDYQSPEGFYSVSARQLNPNSAYHRAFNIGFPNAFDRQNGRTGGALMVHGACKSVGCFAMTDKVIDEIYVFVEAALRGGQHDVPVHIFPFRMTDAVFAKETRGDWTSLWAVPPEHQKWSGFWQNLKEGYDLFEQTGEPPTAYACGARYAFQAQGGACARIAGW
jgi:murein L,D-transpeptidase YafK